MRDHSHGDQDPARSLLTLALVLQLQKPLANDVNDAVVEFGASTFIQLRV